MEVTSLIKDEMTYIREKNILHFIKAEDERPRWSKALDDWFANNPKALHMKRKYAFHCKKINDDVQMASYFQYITESGGIIVDLASGPSGYFAPVFQFMSSDSMFIATDASKMVIEAHQRANSDKRFYICDVDLDKGLPFRNESIDAFSGNLLDNVDNYRGLLAEISRCLKPNGRFAVVELFYEEGSQTYEYLKKENKVYLSLEYFIQTCSELGLAYKESKIIREVVGQYSKGDLLAIGENDKCYETIVFFEKK